MSALRGKVLRRDEIVFSGIIPRRQNPNVHWVHKACLSFGARVANAVTETTTVLVVGEPTTEKLERAEKLEIPVVSIEWLKKEARTDHKGKTFLPSIFLKKYNNKQGDVNEMTNEVDEVLSQSDEDDAIERQMNSTPKRDDQMVPEQHLDEEISDEERELQLSDDDCLQRYPAEETDGRKKFNIGGIAKFNVSLAKEYPFLKESKGETIFAIAFTALIFVLISLTPLFGKFFLINAPIL
uniref:protein-serine/threonine phosphatase n=1 Tax=Ditylenchus dipsaci TaxID=166011 RepID=A0A915DZN2_9BILA